LGKEIAMMTKEYVLLVESDPDYAARLKEALDEGGVRLRVAGTSLEARRIAELAEPAALLLDLDHPPRESVRLLCDLHARDINPRVLWLSSTVNQAGIERVTNAGAHGLLSKSTDAATSLAAVLQVISGKTFFLEDQPEGRFSGVPTLNESERLLRLLQG
jgi:DNA-binding NarL/FixJ family response regulator